MILSKLILLIIILYFVAVLSKPKLSASTLKFLQSVVENNNEYKIFLTKLNHQEENSIQENYIIVNNEQTDDKFYLKIIDEEIIRSTDDLNAIKNGQRLVYLSQLDQILLDNNKYPFFCAEKIIQLKKYLKDLIKTKLLITENAKLNIESRKRNFKRQNATVRDH